MSQNLEAYLPLKNFRMDLKGSLYLPNTETNPSMSCAKRRSTLALDVEYAESPDVISIAIMLG